MKFRYINIPKLVLEVLRGNYAVRLDYHPIEQPNRTTNLYRFLLSCTYLLHKNLLSYYKHRLKWYMIAACTPTYGQISRVLNYWYPYTKKITIAHSKANLGNTMWYAESHPKIYLYDSSTPIVFLGRGGNYSESPIVNIPVELFSDKVIYNQFISDLNTLSPFYLTYIIKIY